MRAFLTGGTGFVGGHLAERLRAGGWDVRALVRASSKTEILRNSGCECVEGKLDSEKTLLPHLADVDTIFHLAGVTKALSAKGFRAVNGIGTGQLVQAAVKAGFQGRFVLLSSQAAAGPALPGNQLRTEEDNPSPVSLYGRSKLEGERHVWRARRRFPVTILRPGAIYGPREHEIYEIIKPLQRTGITVASGPDICLQMTHVEDVVDAIWRAANEPKAANQTFFITSPEVHRYSEVMSQLGDALGRRVRMVNLPLRLGWALAGALDTVGRLAGKPISPFGCDKMREVAAGSWLADSSKLTRLCGWQNQWTLNDGLRQTIEWYRQNDWL